MNINALKTFTVERMDVYEMIGLLDDAERLRSRCESMNVDEPDFLGLTINTLKREIRSRMADKLEAEKRRLTAQLDALKTNAERKAELQRQLEAVNSQLDGK
jgi:hypothetical protein